jgi:hypothetical protein
MQFADRFKVRVPSFLWRLDHRIRAFDRSVHGR